MFAQLSQRHLDWLVSVTWRLDVFQRTSSSMVSLFLVQWLSADQLCGSGMLANEISNLLRYRVLGICCSKRQQLATSCAEWYQGGIRKKKRTVDGEERARFYITLSTHVPPLTEAVTKIVCKPLMSPTR